MQDRATLRDSAAATTLVEVLNHWAHERPEGRAYSFLRDGEDPEAHLSWRELDARARAVAASLERAGAQGRQALMLYPPGLEFIVAFCACLYAGVVAVPAYLPASKRHLPRLRSIARDARPAIVLTHSTQLRRLRGARAVTELEGLDWLTTDEVDAAQGETWSGSGPSAGDLAFLQYTSGSTGAPKGVMVSHANLMHQAEILRRSFELDSSAVIVGWLPQYHDMGLIGNILEPLYLGARCILMSPVAFLQKPLRWLAAIQRYGATVSGGPDFAYGLCADRIGAADRASLDLSDWQVAFSGAEPVRAATLDRFGEAFAPFGFRRQAFYPCYGMAEATLMITGGERSTPPVEATVSAAALERHQVVQGEGEDARRLIGCGRTCHGQRLRIVDPKSLEPCALGAVGEIWLAGESVAHGYWRQDELTAQTFGARLADEGPYLRTGDLGFVRQGELFVTGRLKDLIIIRGRNHYPQDIELTAEGSHPSLRPSCGAAVAVEAAGEERLVVIHEVERHPRDNLEVIADSLRQAVAETHQVRVYDVVLIRATSLPKTSSGKVRRQACRAAYLEGDLVVLSRSTLTPAQAAEVVGIEIELDRETLRSCAPERRHALLEGFLRHCVARVSRVQASAIDPSRSLTSLGLDSLAAVELETEIAHRLGVSVPLAELLAGASLDDLTARLAAQLDQETLDQETEERLRSEPDSALPDESPGSTQLSYGQRALWYLHRLDSAAGAYNLAGAARVQGDLDADALGRALAALADRHPGLRTTFGLAGDRPEARINPQARLDLRIEEIAGPERGAAEARLAAEAYRPFDLETGPLLRLLVLRTEGGRQDKPGNVHILLAVHHIVADFASVAVLLRDLGLLYDAETGGLHADLVPLTATPADFARAEERLLRGASGERLRRYWQRQLGGELPLLDLPTDRPRPPLLTFAGDRCRRLIEGATSDALEACAASHDATVFMLLLAAFQTLLHRYSGQRDLTVGTPMALRDNAEYTDLIGYLVNPVVLRGDLRHDPDFIGLLGSTRKVVHGALVHRAYPFPKLVEDLQAGHDPGRSPLFQAMLVWHADRLPAAQGLAGLALGVPGLAVDLGGLRLESMALPCRSAQFDLSLEAARLEEGLVTALSFNSDLYDAATAQRLLGHLATLLTGIAADPTRRLSELPLLTEGERRQLFSAWEPQADSDVCLHDLFAAAAAEHAEREAVIDGERRITYRQLARCARRLANHLQQLGVGPEVRVGLCAGRSVEMLVGLLGILTAGGAYVPLDPAYPRRRLAFILEDSRVSLLLLGGGVSVDLPVHGAREVDLDAFGPDADLGQESSSLAQQTVPDNLAYFIYTSGSTGRPKGVSITHRSAAARVCWAAEIFSPTELQGMLAATSICFDLSVFEIFAPLCHGGRVILADHALGLPTLPAASEVTLINTVPSSLAELVSGAARLPAGVRTVNLAGEPLSRRLVQRIYQHSDAERVLDLYGPSEDTTYSTFAEAKRDDPREPTIGRPLRATRVALVDAGLRLMARGLVGEIVIGGVGLARGYLDRPGLTAQRFQPDPFGSHFGHRLYRTGDLGRLRPSGDLEYLGRTDHQVKIRGFRIELGEIETVLEGHPQVAEAVAVARRDKSGDPLLVAYLAVTNGGGPAAAELRRYLGAQLPAFMVPQAFVTLDALPRSPNGKIDRSALPAPDADAAGPQTAFVAPSTEVELLLAEIWCEVLGVERVGIHDDFFDLGGHSLKATRVLARVSEVFQVDLPVRSLLESPTILGLTEAIARQLLAEADPEALVELGI